MIRIGVIGTGNMGRNHVRILREEWGRFHLVGIYDADPQRAGKIACTYGTEAFSSMDALLDNVEAVVVAVPSSLHPSVGGHVAARGKHALIEKPLALSSREAEALTQSFTKAGCLLAVGHVERFNPVVVELKKVLRNESIIALEARRYGSFDGRISDANVVEDLMIHDIDLADALLDHPPLKAVWGCGRMVKSGRLDHVNAMIQYENGLQADLGASRVAQNKIREILVHSESGLFEANLLTRSLLVYRNTNMVIEDGTECAYKQDSVIQRVFVPSVEPLRAELLAFADAVDGAGPVAVDGTTAARAIQICERVVQQCTLAG